MPFTLRPLQYTPTNCNAPRPWKTWNSEVRPCIKVKGWNLRSGTIIRTMRMNTAAARVGLVIWAWRNILHELEVAWATMECQVHIWLTNNKFAWKTAVPRSSTYNFACSINEQVLLLIFLWAQTWNHKRWRTNITTRIGHCHSQSNEEKNTSDNFKLHLELAN